MNTFKIIILSFVLILVSAIFVNNIALAELDEIPVAGGSTPTQLANPLGETKDIQTLAGKIINAVLGIVGSLALVMVIYGGFTWMTAAGNQEAVKKGRDILIWAFVGIVIIFSAYALVKFAFTTIGVTG